MLIITGYGLNCEAESKVAWELAGAAPELVHFNDLLERPARLHDYRALMFIGGFSYGDHMSSGHVFALRVKHRMREDLQKFIDAGKLILGVCNGFQIMVKLGLLPGLDNDYFTQTVSLMQNDCGSFQNFWVRLRFESQSPCVFTRGLDFMPLPIRHGEGKIFTLDRDLLAKMEAPRLRGLPLCGPDDRRGDAGISAQPERLAATRSRACAIRPAGSSASCLTRRRICIPRTIRSGIFRNCAANCPERGLGLKIFTNAVEYLRQM